MTTKPNRGPLLTYRCTRCHKSKTKCSGERPSCRSCAARNVCCVYLDKDRKITISVRQLEALQNRLRFFEDSQSSRPEQSDSTPFFEPLLSSSTQEFLARVASVIDPDLEVKFNAGELDTPNIDDDDATLPAGVAVVDNLKKFLGFLQYDYHFFLYDELLLNIDSIYSNGIDRNHPMVISQFCLVMAVGSVYDKNAIVTDEYPGYQYFRLALKYLHEVNSSFSLIAIQTHILFAWYLLILNQKGPASIHCACAVRKALHIGLHKPPESNVSPVVKEHRLRTWWTAFVVETFCVSLLGTPQHISVDHVDVPLPSSTQLGTDEEGLFSTTLTLLCTSSWHSLLRKSSPPSIPNPSISPKTCCKFCASWIVSSNLKKSYLLLLDPHLKHSLLRKERIYHSSCFTTRRSFWHCAQCFGIISI